MEIKTKRIYDAASDDDGYRILVDRLWPRGMKSEHAHVDLWEKQLAPSNELRKWFAHDPAKFSEFRELYMQELRDNPAYPGFVSMAASHGKITLLYAAKDTEHNNAIVLRDMLSAE